MSQTRNLPAAEPLPWLADEPATQYRRWPLTEIAGWLVAAALFAGGAAYWLTLSSPEQPTTSAPSVGHAPSATVRIPEAVPAPAPVRLADNSKDSTLRAKDPRGSAPLAGTAPAARPKSAAPHRPAASAKVAASARTESASGAAREARAGATPALAAAKPTAQPAKSAPAKGAATRAAAPAKGTPATTAATSAKVANAESKAATTLITAKHLVPSASATAARLLATPAVPARRQAYNSMVNLAAFENAKQGGAIWRQVLKSYPPARSLAPAVIQNRDWNGRLFYQFQVGTASAAESQMFCQSVQQLDLRCEVVRFP